MSTKVQTQTEATPTPSSSFSRTNLGESFTAYGQNQLSMRGDFLSPAERGMAIEGLAPSLVYERKRSLGKTFDSIPQSFGESRFGHNFSQVQVWHDGRATQQSSRVVSDWPNSWKKKVSAQGAGSQSQFRGSTARAISASGSGTVTTTYTPEAKDKGTKIVFIQVMRELLDGVPVKPSVAAPAFAYQDADTTSDFYHVDYVSGEKDPYYNGDDPQDFGPQGNAVSTPAVAASTSDTPNYPDGSFPVGKSKLAWEFRTAAFSAAGADEGTYYGYVDWAYAKEKGKAAKTAVGTTSAGTPGSKFESAVELWNNNHGFKMPGKGGGLLGGLLGGGLGAAAGAGIGFALGGPIGALVGSLIGLGVGAATGVAASRKNNGEPVSMKRG